MKRGIAVFAFLWLIRCGGSTVTVPLNDGAPGGGTVRVPLNEPPRGATPDHPLPLMRTQTTPVHGSTPTASPTPTVTRTA